MKVFKSEKEEFDLHSTLNSISMTTAFGIKMYASTIKFFVELNVGKIKIDQ